MDNTAPNILRSEACIAWQIANSGLVAGVIAFAKHESPAHFFACSAGASSDEWLCGDPAETPEGVYITLERHGFDSPASRVQALQQFAQIEGCNWAHLMALTLEQPDG